MTQNYAQAFHYYRLAAEQGHAFAQVDLAGLYRDGQGVKQDYSRAVAWAGRATAQGNANGQTTLGYLYDMGYGVPKDAVQALALYRFAAAQGKTWAQYRTRAFLIPAANRINP